MCIYFSLSDPDIKFYKKYIKSALYIWNNMYFLFLIYSYVVVLYICIISYVLVNNYNTHIIY